MSLLAISEPLLADVEQHAVATYPEECCGILLGGRTEHAEVEQATVSQVIRARNVHPGPRSRRYAIAPEELLQAHQRAHRLGEVVVGYYHSHPDREALPSGVDRRAADPDASYLILAVRRHRVVARRSWRLCAAGTHFEEERLG